MKIKKYTNSAWADLGKPVKKFDDYTDEATTLPLTIEVSATDAIENYQVYGASGGVGEEVVMIISQTTIEDASERQLRLRVTATTNDQSIIISTTGIIAYRGETVPEAGLTIESAAASSDIADISLDGTSVSTTAKDTKGGVHYRGYCVLSDGTVLYNDIISTTLEQEQQQLSSDSVTHYKIPFLCSHKNLVAGTISNASVNSSGVVAANSTFDLAVTPIESGKSYSIKFSNPESSSSKVFCGIFSSYPDIGSSTYNNARFTFNSDYYTFTAPISGYLASTFTPPTDAVVFEGSVPYQSNYDLFIGGSKLGEDEYLDYWEQKIYKDVSGTLTPTDPPLPFPTLTTYLGENNIDVDTTTAPDKVVVEYKGWKSIGEPQIYDGGEWKDEPSEDINLVYQLDNAYWSDGYVKSDGTIAPNRPDFQYNEHFAVEPSTTYVLAYESSTLDCEVSWYTEDKTFIRTDEIMNNRVCFFTSPSNAKYAILSVPTVATYLLFAKKNDANSLPQITDPIDGTNWKQGWIKSDGTINTDGDYAYYDGAIDVSDCSKVFVGHSNCLVTSKYLEIYEMDSSDQKTAYKDEEYIDGTYKELSLNANTTKLRFSTSRCTDVMIIKSRVYYKT